MENQSQNENHNEVPADPAAYEAPRIETVLTPEELEREVFYAGAVLPPSGSS